MKLISLTQGKFAVVDDEDYEWLNQWKWCVMETQGLFYAVRRVYTAPRPHRKSKAILMHRLILRAVEAPRCVKVDHINGDGLDNRRSNLRLATNGQNGCNRGAQSNNHSSGLKGVYWFNQTGKWTAKITVNGRTHHLGYFDDIEEAARAYDAAALQYHGDFARTNATILSHSKETTWQ
jgi:hypothetical protein